jgi:hypothetical protein
MSVEHEPRVEPQLQPGGQPLGRVPDEPFYRRGEQARRWGALLVLVGVVWLVFSITVQGPLGGFGFGIVERTVDIPAQSFAVERVVINGLADTIELLPASGDEVRLEGVRHGFGWNGGAADAALEQLEVAVSASGNTLTIEVRRPGFPGPASFGRAPFAELRLAIPAETSVEASLVSGDLTASEVRADLSLTTVSGDVQIEETVGNLRLRSTSGDIEVSEHRGAFDVETVSGDVEAGGELENPRVETVSGDVELEGVSGAAELHSISGNLAVLEARDASLQVESTSGDVVFAGSLAAGASSRISNISGDVEVEVADPADLRLELSTTSGDIDSDLELRDVERERRRLSGVLGDGDSALTVSTTSGDVRVDGE